MKNKTVLNLAYTLVTAGFTTGLVILLILLIRFFNGQYTPGGTVDIVISEGRQNQFRTIEERGIVIYNFFENPGAKPTTDTSESLKSDDRMNEEPIRLSYTISLPLHYLKNSRVVKFYFLQIRFLIVYLLWLYIAYQVFLILYDIRKERYFEKSNSYRLNKIGFSFLVMAGLFLITFRYAGTITANMQLSINPIVSGRIITLDFLTYLVIGALMLILSVIFKHGTVLKQENDLTV